MEDEPRERNIFRELRDHDQRECVIPRNPFKFSDGVNLIRIMTCPVARRLRTTDTRTKAEVDYDRYECVVYDYASKMCLVTRFSLNFFNMLADLPGHIASFPMVKRLRIMVKNAGLLNVEYTNVTVLEGSPAPAAIEMEDLEKFISHLPPLDANHLIKNSSTAQLEELKTPPAIKAPFKNPLLKAPPPVAAAPDDQQLMGSKRKMLDAVPTPAYKRNGEENGDAGSGDMAMDAE